MTGGVNGASLVRTTGPLRPVELATAAVMGGVSLVLAVIGTIVPIAAVLQLLAAVPLGVVAQRHRPRALVAAAVAAGTVGFLIAGTAPLSVLFLAALVGGIVGDVKRRGRGIGTAVAAFAAAAPAVAALSVGLLAVFSSLRELALVTIRNSAHGAGVLFGPQVSAKIDAVAGVLVDHWWWTVSVVVILGMLPTAAVAWWALGATLDRLERLPVVDRLDGAAPPGPPSPVPVALEQAGLRYPGARRDALVGVDLVLARPQLVAVVGQNGSGKSTVVRLLAGTPPTSGRVRRDGPAGLGLPGGTALIAQRPESQVLGVRVRDDVVWGLPAGTEVDVDALLAEVGLGGLGARNTTTLSGGQLQRLAIAAALARRPTLLLSDESTAMVDPQGRAELMDLMAALPGRTRTTVVHVTHRGADAAVADRVVAVHDGRVVELERSGAPVLAEPDVFDLPGRPSPPGPTLLALRGVGHVYDAGTPWAHRALAGVDLDVARGEALLLVGGNGSGKSTLAWVLGGLLHPTEGEALLNGRPVSEQVGAVAVAFQQARLQVQRPTVGEDVAAAGRLSGAGHPQVAAALRTVGLDPTLTTAGVDTLSGGQLRRVALAGLLITQPDVLVLDEPLAGLDGPSRTGMAQVLTDLRDRGVTMVVVTHDVTELAPLCHRVVRVEQGRLQPDGLVLR
ncbi:MAG: ATP-binding cassette domain-containing protein [Mycobacteriaceae bacterium]